MFVVGDWIDAYDGIGIVLSVNPIYVEEYSRELDKTVGDELQKIIVYKIFCNYEGKVIKRKVVRSCSDSLCSIMSDDSKGVLEKAIEEDKPYYNKFISLSESEIHNEITVWMQLPALKLDDLKDKLIDMSNVQTNGFTILDILKEVKAV